MECRAVVNMLSDYLDGFDMWLSDNEVLEIESHLVICSQCQHVKLELHEIRTAARELPLHTPPRSLWTRIANTVELELPKSERPTRIELPEMSWWGRIKSRRFTFSLPQLAGAGALAVALIVSGIFNSSSNRSDRPIFTGVQNALLPDEDQIKADIERRLNSINARKAGWDPDTRKAFDKALIKIEEALRDSRQKLLANPKDTVQQQMVLTLYSEKRQLLDDIERLKW